MDGRVVRTRGVTGQKTSHIAICVSLFSINNSRGNSLVKYNQRKPSSGSFSTGHGKGRAFRELNKTSNIGILHLQYMCTLTGQKKCVVLDSFYNTIKLFAIWHSKTKKAIWKQFVQRYIFMASLSTGLLNHLQSTESTTLLFSDKESFMIQSVCFNPADNSNLPR